MSDKQLYAIVLAAGLGSRFGATKQLQEFKGCTLVERAIRLAESVCGRQTILVVGKDWQQVAAASAPIEGFLTINTNFEQGLASSIACGVRSVADVADGILLLLADQPLITQDHLKNLIDRWQDSEDAILASSYAATVGPPIIFSRRDFAALIGLQGDKGARVVLEAEAERVVQIEFEDAALDIDRPEDLPTAY